MLRLNKHTLRTLGFALIVLGFLLSIVTLLGGSGQVVQLTVVPPGAFQWYWVGILAIFSGIALIIIGIILLIVPRSMKPRQQTDAAIIQDTPE